MPPKTTYLRTRVEPHIKRAWTHLAQRHHQKEGSYLYRVITDHLKASNITPTPNAHPDTKSTPPPPLKTQTIATRLTLLERKALDQILAIEGGTPASLLLGLIRTRINQQPHFSQKELQALREANRQLLAIGRNFNQLVTAINSGGLTDNPFSPRYANAMLERVNTQARTISDLIKRNRQRGITHD